MNNSNKFAAQIDKEDPQLSYNAKLRKAFINPKEKQDLLRTFDDRN